MGIVAGMTLALVIFMVLLSCLKNYNSWRFEPKLKPGQRLPPGDMGWPVVGTMMDFLKNFKSTTPDQFLGNMIAKWGRTGFYRTHLFFMPTILATTPETVKLFLLNDDLFFTGWPKSTNDLMGRKSFIAIDASEHKRLRDLTSRALNGTEMLSRYVPRIEKMALKKLEEWANKDEIHFLQELKTFNFDIIADIMMSIKPGPDTIAIRTQFEGFNLGLRAMPIKLPGFAYTKAIKARKELIRLIQNAIDERRRSKLRPTDMLQIMMEAKDEEGRLLTDEELIDMTIMYLNAGHESTAHTTMWVMVFLSENLHAYEKVKKEQESIWENKNPAEGITLADYRKMKFLQFVLNETLRITNISLNVFRKTLKDVEFNGYLIPKGWTAQAFLRGVHLDPELYPNPNHFDPERWIGLASKPGSFIPFGAGSRLCPGMELARLEVCILVHYLIVNYKFIPKNPNCRKIYLPHPKPIDNCPAVLMKL